MLKKILSFLLTLSIMNFSYLPAMANNQNSPAELTVKLNTEIDINKSSKGQIVQFISKEDYKDEYGRYIPQGTIFQGKIKSIKHSRWGYRRAKAHIFINKMTLPNGQKYKIRAFTKPRTIKGSAIGNVGKGILCTPAALVVGAGGLCLIVIEGITIVGIPLVVPTAAAVCGTIGKLTNGVNCHKSEGAEFKIKIKKNMPQQEATAETNNTNESDNNDNTRDTGIDRPDDNILEE